LVVRASPVVSVFPGDGLLRLAWSSDEFAKSYVVERALSPSGPFSTIAQGVELQGYDDVGLSNGTAYFYRVRTLFTNEVYGFPSTVVSGIPAVSAGAPSNLVVTGTTSAQLSWTAPSNYSAFQVFRASTSNGTYSLVGTSSLPSFTHNLTSDGVGHYRVRAVWDGVNSTFSNTAVFRRAQVVGVNASGSTSPLRVTVSWTAYTGASSYEVRRAASANGTYSTIAANAAGSSYIDTAVALGNSYYYRVIPKFSDGTRGRDSDFAVGRVDTTTQPTGLSVLGWTTTSVTLTWPTVSGSISSYKVFRRLSGGSYSSALATVPQSASRLTTTLNSGFAGGVGYAFVVRAVSNTGVESANSNEVFVQMVSSPTWVAVIPGHNRVDLSWTSMTGASFRVLRSEDGVNFTELVTGYAGSIYADTSVVNGRQYFYLVEATYTGMPGFVVSTPLSSGVTPGVVPLTPGGLAATVAASGATVDLSWAPVSGATGYQVLYGTSPGGPHPLVSAVMPGTSTSISELTDGTPYYFVVRALLGTVPSAGVSNEVAAVPMSTPAAPTVRAQADAQASVLVSWAPVSAGGVAPQSYRLERSSDGVAFSLLASGITGTSQVDATVNLSTRYEYRYQPVFTGGVLGGYSAASVGVVPGTRPETPAQLRARAGAATAVELTWAPVTNVEGYSIERATAAAGPYAEVTYVTGVGTTVHTDTSVSEGVTYFYRIRSRNSDGVLSFASAVVGVSLVGAPQNLAATVSDGKIALSWDALAGASGYLVSRAKSLDGSYERFSPVASPGLEDTAVEDGVTYLYRVTGVFADGSVSRDSAAVSAQAVSRFDLQVPIELTDQPLASLGAPITFDRTRTVIEPAAYDGSVTYYFEAVATNTDSVSRQAQVVDPEGGVLATLTFPSGTPTPTRLRVPFTGALAQKIPLRVALEATPSDALLMLYSARVLVQQVGATRTKLYFPLLSSGTAVAAGDATAPIVATSQAQAESLAFGATLYRRLLEHQSPLREVNPWELEAVVATSGGAIGNLALRDHISGATVAASAVEAAGTALRVAGAQFADGVEGFGGTEEGRDFELSAFCLSDCDLGAVQIYKAGLWMALRSLSKVEVPFRSTLAGVVPGPAAASVLDAWRVFPDLSAFSAPAGGAPELFFQAVGAVVSEPDSATVDLVGWGSADQAGTATPVAGSSLSFNSDDLTWARVAGALPAPAGERYSTRIAPGVGAVDLRDATVVIRARK
jgi:fibronectin type 3 domain-containing protein